MEIIRKNKQIFSRPIQKIKNKSYFSTNVPLDAGEGKRKYSWIITDSEFKEKYSEHDLEGHKLFSDADFDIDLSGIPRPGSTLSADAYVRYVIEGEKLPEIRETFRQVSASIDRFVGFDGSFANQSDMADFLASWVIGTYATDVFDTVGYIWPNGERGSGKSQCLKTVMAMAFMGQTVTSSSSFATIRDEAALGATLGFDDCENLYKMDAHKRELLLTGNTKGAQVMVKEPGLRDGDWVNKYIDAFAPRAFTSIGLPDDTLSSRTIMIPLTRSGDLSKTRLKPTNPADWGDIDPDDLRDSLWINVARGLDRIEDLKKDVNEQSDLSGRDFDIFQAPLTIALWLEQDHGIAGLFVRMQKVMEAYHATKQKNLLPSVEQVVLQSMADILNRKEASHLSIPTGDIVIAKNHVLDRWDITDENLQSIDRQKVGMLLGRLGFERAAGHGKARSWLVTLNQVEQSAKLAGIKLEAVSQQEESTEILNYFDHRSIVNNSEELPF